MPSNDDLVKYFIQRTDKRLEEMNQKLDTLMAFRWKIMGAATSASVLISVAWELVKTLAGGK